MSELAFEKKMIVVLFFLYKRKNDGYLPEYKMLEDSDGSISIVELNNSSKISNIAYIFNVFFSTLYLSGRIIILFLLSPVLFLFCICCSIHRHKKNAIVSIFFSTCKNNINGVRYYFFEPIKKPFVFYLF